MNVSVSFGMRAFRSARKSSSLEEAARKSKFRRIAARRVL